MGLERLFVKNSEQVENPQVRTAYGVMASVVGVIANVLLFALKITVGTLIQSISVTADAFNNLSDAASSVIGLVGVKIAARPGDADHPFGHGRAEYIAALIVAFLVLEVGLSCLESSVQKIFAPSDTVFSVLTVVLLAASMLVKVWLGLFNRRLGKKIDSTVMKATAADAFGDVLITGATVLSLVLSHVFSYNLDGFMGAAVAVLVILSGIGIVRDTVTPLLGEAADPELEKRIVRQVMSYDGIIGTHDLIIHSYGPGRYMATIHAEVPNDSPLEETHELIDKIEHEVQRDLGVLLVIHMDPIETNDEVVLEKRRQLWEIVSEVDEDLTFHDFRLVNGTGRINLIFDLVVPRRYTDVQAQALAKQIDEMMRREDARCHCVITVDRRYDGK